MIMANKNGNKNGNKGNNGNKGQSAVRSLKPKKKAKPKPMTQDFASSKQRLDQVEAKWATVWSEFEMLFPGLYLGLQKLGYENPLEDILNLRVDAYGTLLRQYVRQTIVAMNAEALLGKSELIVNESVSNLTPWGNEVTDGLLDFVRDSMQPAANELMFVRQEISSLVAKRTLAKRSRYGAFGGK